MRRRQYKISISRRCALLEATLEATVGGDSGGDKLGPVPYCNRIMFSNELRFCLFQANIPGLEFCVKVRHTVRPAVRQTTRNVKMARHQQKVIGDDAEKLSIGTDLQRV